MIKTFSQFIKSIFEKKGDSYSYGCAMIYFNFPEQEWLHSQIDPEDVYTDDSDRTFGLEDEPHTTLLYGLHSNEIDDSVVMDICKQKPIGSLILTNASLFENEKYDVLKFDVKNPVLYEINAELAKLPHTTDFPNYHPHATVGYLKPGTGKKYVDELKGYQFKVQPDKIVYSKPDGSRIEESWS